MAPKSGYLCVNEWQQLFVNKYELECYHVNFDRFVAARDQISIWIVRIFFKMLEREL